jgi:hypothetical protein
MDTFRVVEATLLERLSGRSRSRDAVRFALDALSRSGSVTRRAAAKIGSRPPTCLRASGGETAICTATCVS